jgi:adenylate cyclase
MLGQFTEALEPLQECVSRAPNFSAAHKWLAATYGQLGRLAEAQAEAAEVLRLHPASRISGPQPAHFKHAKHAEHYLDGLRKAGLPE